MTTVVIKGKKVQPKKKTAKKKAATKKPTVKKAVKKKVAKKKTAPKPHTSAGVAKTQVKQPSGPETKKTTTPANTGAGKMTQLEAAFKVLQENGSEMNCKAMVNEMIDKGFWKPTKGGLTPANTLNAGIGTEIRKKGKDARFKKTAPGKYIVNPDYKG